MAKLTNQEIIEQLEANFAGKYHTLQEPHGLLTFEVSRQDITAVLTWFKNSLSFIHLTDITAVHYPEQDKPFAVVYHLHNLVGSSRVRIKVLLEEADLHIPTATTLWQGANWMERETYDFFGVIFDGHPDLRRILNVDEMTAFPMRKEYALEDPNRADKKDYFFGR
jgi:NADH-quinone oxidoreductase subunit C